MADWWVNELEIILKEVDKQRSAEDVRFGVPCNIFAGRALEKGYDVHDFAVNARTNDGDPYMVTTAMGSFLKEHSFPKVGEDSPSRYRWRLVGKANDQSNLQYATRLADEGHPVVAIWPGRHISLIIPGLSSYSKKWKLEVPNSAQWAQHAPKSDYVGSPLSRGYRSQNAKDVTIYYCADTIPKWRLLWHYVGRRVRERFR